MGNNTKLQKEYQSEVIKVVDSIISGYDPEKIIQFGSGAAGNVDRNSDIDLLVIKETDEPYWERNKRVTLMYRGWYPTDIFVLTPRELNQAIRENRFMVTEEILPRGKIIYEKPIERYKGDIKAWWQSATDDVKWAEHDFGGGFYNQTCLGAQQIVEKALKTYLLSQNIKVEKTHDLVRLLAEAKKKDKRFSKFLDHCKLLDKYYVDTRYPRFGVMGDWTEDEAKEALSLAKEVLDFVAKQVQPILRKSS